MSEAAPSPEQPEDLELVSTPDLLVRLLAELEIRHERDVFILFIKRQVDGGRPALLSRVSGDAYAVEGALAVLSRWAKRLNDQDPRPFRGSSKDFAFFETGQMPGADPDVE